MGLNASTHFFLGPDLINNSAYIVYVSCLKGFLMRNTISITKLPISRV